MASNQDIYTLMLRDHHVTCTCDLGMREERISRAREHYHSCMLYQITRTILSTYRAIEMELRTD